MVSRAHQELVARLETKAPEQWLRILEGIGSSTECLPSVELFRWKDHYFPDLAAFGKGVIRDCGLL